MKKQNIVLDKDYYKNRYKKVSNIAGSRYSPETNVELPLSDIFNGLCRTKEFYNEIRKATEGVKQGSEYDKNDWDDVDIKKQNNILSDTLGELLEIISKIDAYSSDLIRWDEVTRLTEQAISQLFDLISEYKRCKEELKDINPVSYGRSNQTSPSIKIGYTIYDLQNLQATLANLDKLSRSSKARLSNKPYLLIKGDAGIGKTHLLCDLYRIRTQGLDLPLSIFLSFGGHFRNALDFWDTFLSTQGFAQLFKNKAAFLNYIDSQGEKNNCRSLIMIDALNESSNGFWHNHFTDLLDDISHYNHIALIVTIRTGFEDVVLTEDQKNRLECTNHTGFACVEWQAVRKYFEHYNIPLPEVPLLNPEFQHPLFLKIFCDAFKNKKNSHVQDILRGHAGSTNIFEAFIDKASDSLVKKYDLGVEKKNKIWNSIIKQMAKAMVTANSDIISETALQRIINESHPHVNPSDLIHDMEKLLLITRIANFVEKGRIDVRFPFQRFSDYLIARYIFKEYSSECKRNKKDKDIDTAKCFFSKKGKFGKAISSGWYLNLLGVLSVMCPEHLKGTEFIDVAPYIMSNSDTALYAVLGFIDSLVWRKRTAFSSDLQNTKRIINEYLILNEGLREQFFDALLTIAPVEKHPYNSRWLNTHLKKLSMPERDAAWSVFLHNQLNENYSVERILSWTRTENMVNSVSDTSLYLLCITLSWFLSTSNRFIRDRATKGLASIFIHRPAIIVKLLMNFVDVDDSYITERLYAATYSSVLHDTIEDKKLEEIARYVYKTIFESEKPPIHILLRDYARGIIEVALSRELCKDIDPNLIYPPYKSEWPADIPSFDELRDKYYPNDQAQLSVANRQYMDIWISVMELGDFARYVIGTNSCKCSWTGIRINDTTQSAIQRSDNSNYNLTKQQRPTVSNAKTSNSSQSSMKMKRNDLDNGVKSIKVVFTRSTDEVRQKDNTIVLRPHSIYDNLVNDPSKTFDLSIAQRWIFNRVVELGYNPSLHNHFDAGVKSAGGVGRSAHKAERIGKKYQWIAYHEFMGMLSDNFKYRDDLEHDSQDHYRGPWEPHIRDIDPTLLIQNDKQIEHAIPLNTWKAMKGDSLNLLDQVDDFKWLEMGKDKHDMLSLIEVTDDDSKKWLLLKGELRWQMPITPDNEMHINPTREAILLIKSCVIKESDLEQVQSWWKRKRPKGNWMPRSGHFYNLFLGEYPYSDAYKYTKGDKDEWVSSKGFNDTGLDIPMLITDDCYLNEFSLDCSHDNSHIKIELPSATLVKDMNLRQKYIDGRFFQGEKLVSSPLSIFEESDISGLVFDKSILTEYLSAHGYTLIWSVIGEKSISGTSYNTLETREINGLYWLDDNNDLDGSFIISRYP